MLHRFSILTLLLALLAITGCGKTYKMDAVISTNDRPWPYFRGSQMAEGAVTPGEYTGRLDIIWEVGTNDKPAGPLTLSQEALVYPSSRKRIKMYAAKDGDYLGRLNVKGWPEGGLSVWQALAWYVVGPQKNELRAVDLTRRKQIWEKPLLNPLDGVLFVHDQMVVAGSSEGYLIAHHPSLGNQLWRLETERRFSTPPVYTGTYIIQPTDDAGLLVISPEDGSIVHEIALDGPVVAPVAVGDYLFVNDLLGGIYAIDIETREIVWKQHAEGPIWTSPTVADGRLFVAHSGGVVLAFDARSGRALWSVEVGDVIGASPIVAGEYVIFGTKTGKLYSLRASDGKSASSRRFKGAFSVSPVTDGRFVYIATDKGEIACLGNAPRPNLRADNADPSR